MKIIKINEGQISLLTKLIESESAPDFEDGDIKEYGDSSENGTTATVQDNEGNPKYGKMPTGDEFAKTQTPQSWWANGTMSGSKMFRP